MSTQEFKPGDRVRLREGASPISAHEGVTEFTVETVFAEGRVLKLVGVTGVRGRDRFEHVEPEWVVGQQVSGSDYERLPVGSVVEKEKRKTRTKTAPNFWECPGDFHWTDSMMAGAFERTITHLPDATQPEDATDAYVEPEPLEEGDHVTANAVHDLAQALIWTRDYVQPAVALPAKDGWSWYDALKEHAPEFLPVLCPSLHHVESEGVYIRCENQAGHVGVHGAGFSPGFKQWHDDDARIIESGAS